MEDFFPIKSVVVKFESGIDVQRKTLDQFLISQMITRQNTNNDAKDVGLEVTELTLASDTFIEVTLAGCLI